MNSPYNIVIYLYYRMTALDAIGPYEVFRCVPGAEVRFAAKHPGLIKTDSGLEMLNAEFGINDIDGADILLVPGGDAALQTKDQEVLQWIRRLHETTKWTTSVCVGSLILGAAGLLKGLQATTHWNTMEALQLFGAKPVNERFVQQGKIITAAGVSAGIDMALWLVALEWGEEMAQQIQLTIEYDPQPPFHTGSPDKATSTLIENARDFLIELYSPEARNS
jgi:transcriptional regulator GlxA family with amidase domain